MPIDLRRRIESSEGLTPVDRAIASTVLALRGDFDSLSIKDLARASHTSTAGVSRFCRKIGLRGFRELKTEVARSTVQSVPFDEVNVDYPFMADDSPRLIVQSFRALYDFTIADAVSCVDYSELYSCARLIARARSVSIYTHSHNLHVAATFRERLLRIGRIADLPAAEEEQRILASASQPGTVAIAISYSGRATFLPKVLGILRGEDVPTIFVGANEGARLHPHLAHYLRVSNREDPQQRISQFASHIALQYILDVLYGCVFTLNYDDNMAFLQRTMPRVDDRRFER
ncbi:MurR/RpiR family transcriptional regulator [Olsenella sp. HMSC062G07]|uniref:MurR/RpiR family transcriptional regulator n=1 Tax=Olsenella sp. HMSC062G07 TaxID=1739330 RepID=UPI0008CDB07C|nr:MurR/RpiR family transcriptional regulator [Olsenella sp. HMSC062G07]OFK23360.1 hypothetical protein HMPREF2826_05530 [Olsenella sp. HMSC062G07]